MDIPIPRISKTPNSKENLGQGFFPPKIGDLDLPVPIPNSEDPKQNFLSGGHGRWFFF